MPHDWADGRIAELVVELYQNDPKNTQILSSSRIGPGGTKRLNELCQAALTAKCEPLLVWNAANDCHEHTGMHLGDVLLCTRNLWDRPRAAGRRVNLDKAVERLLRESHNPSDPQCPSELSPDEAAA